MRQLNLYIFAGFLFCPGILPAQNKNDSAFVPASIQAIHIQEINCNKQALQKNIAAAELTLYVFLSPECPLCRNYTPVLTELQHRYREQLQVIGIIPGKAYTKGDVCAYEKKFKPGFPLLIDTEKKLTAYLKASVTPEVVLLDRNGQLVYRGAIDDQVKKLGEKSIRTSRNYLNDAITSGLNHQSMAIKRTKAIGCTINDY